MSVIDFYGLPGSGKSTCAHRLAEELREKGLRVLEPSYRMDHENSPRMRKFKKLVWAIRYSIAHPRKARALRSAIRESGVPILKYFVNAAYKAAACEAGKSRWDYIVFDEGFYQLSVSINMKQYRDPKKTAHGLCAVCRYPVVPVYLRVEISEVMNRLQNRGEHDSRVEREPDEAKRIEMLRQIQSTCDALDAALTVPGQDPGADAERIIGYLNGEA